MSFPFSCVQAFDFCPPRSRPKPAAGCARPEQPRKGWSPYAQSVNQALGSRNDVCIPFHRPLRPGPLRQTRHAGAIPFRLWTVCVNRQLYYIIFWYFCNALLPVRFFIFCPIWRFLPPPEEKALERPALEGSHRWRKPWRDPPLKERPVPPNLPRRDLPRRKAPIHAYGIAKYGMPGGLRRGISFGGG